CSTPPPAPSCCLFFFFFSSRRRHTRCLSDWSSDVCSSDLSLCRHGDFVDVWTEEFLSAQRAGRTRVLWSVGIRKNCRRASGSVRSEERRVGKEGRSRWCLYQE